MSLLIAIAKALGLIGCFALITGGMLLWYIPLVFDKDFRERHWDCWWVKLLSFLGVFIFLFLFYLGNK